MPLEGAYSTDCFVANCETVTMVLLWKETLQQSCVSHQRGAASEQAASRKTVPPKEGKEEPAGGNRRRAACQLWGSCGWGCAACSLRAIGGARESACDWCLEPRSPFLCTVVGRFLCIVPHARTFRLSPRQVSHPHQTNPRLCACLIQRIEERRGEREPWRRRPPPKRRP